MATEWTPSQRAGVTTVGRGLLVSAAAGSGKTTVLAGRCAHLVCDAPPPYRCEVDQLLVLTFTRATAAEMRHRVDGALRARIAATPTDHPEHGRLEAQSRLIDRAAITTLDSFCGRLLRRHFQAVGLDPNFTTLDEHEAKLLRRDVARELFDAQYDGPRADAFTDLIDRWGDGDDSKVIERVESLHNLMTGMADPERWRAEAAARAREAADGSVPLGETRLGKALAGAIAAELRGLIGRCDRLADAADRAEGLGAYASHVRELREWPAAWLAMAERGDLPELAAAVGAFEKPKIPTLKQPWPAGKELIHEAINKLKEEMGKGEVAQLCGRPAEEWRAGMAAVAGPTVELLDLTAEFGKRYQRAKDALRAVDFADLGRLALRVLTDPATGGPSRAAESLHREFRHVLVDEYQDINELQDALLNRMSTECMVPEVESNLFRVGDVKQSIYGFRLAEPRRFVGLFDRLRDGRDAGELILLSENFRSRAPLLAAVNFAFSKLMTEEAAEIDYSDGHELAPGARFAGDSDQSFTGAPVELHLLIKPDGKSNRSEDEAGDEEEDGDDLDAQEREATVIAKRLHELKASRLVHDKAGPRPMKWSDAAVLLRSTKEKAERFAVALRACGVPVHADAKTGFFGAVEVRDVIALLRVLDNRRQDVPLAAVLRSPLAELPDREDALARIRLASPDRAVPFHEAAARYAVEHDDDLAERLRRVLADLDRWRDLTRRRPLAEALWAIYAETGYLAFCAGLPGGAQRAANLVELHERARQFGTFQRQGLARFLAFLDDLSEAGDLGQPSVASEADDVVRVMSIHTAKGLEFPVVVLPDLGKGHNLTSSTGSVLFDRELGVGMEVIDGERHVRHPSLGSLLVGRSLRRQAVAEELRVLYVAMTRAKEHLILVGGAGEQEVAGWASKWAGHIGPMPATDVLAGGSMLAWLGPVAVAGRSVKGHTFEMWKHGAEEVEAWRAEMAEGRDGSGVAEALKTLQPLAAPPEKTGDFDQVVARLEQKYPFDRFAKLPAARSVTAVAPDDPKPRHAPQLDLPRWFAESQRQTAADAGSAVHVALQHLDFKSACDLADVRRQVAALVDKRLLTPVAAKAIKAESLAWLMTTVVGQLLRDHAADVRRELAVHVADSAVIADDPMDRPMVRGRIDALVPTADGMVLVDYKTDRLGPGQVAARAGLYRPQVAGYREAVERITGRPVAASYLVFLTAREVVAL